MTQKKKSQKQKNGVIYMHAVIQTCFVCLWLSWFINTVFHYNPCCFSSIISVPFKVPCPKYLLSNLSHISSRQYFQVWEESTSFKNLLVFVFIEFWSKNDVVFDGPVLNPGLLRDIGSGALNGKGSNQAIITLTEMEAGAKSGKEQAELRFEELNINQGP